MSEDIDKMQLSKAYLSPTIKLLGDILGEVIVEQAGKEYLELVEKLRLLAKRFRENDDRAAFNSLKDMISELTPQRMRIVIKAFGLFFQLANLAEEDYQIHTNEILKERGLIDNSLKEAMTFALSRDFMVEDLINLLGSIKFKLVWTSHPTEARRLTNLIKLREIYYLIERLEKADTKSADYHTTRMKIKERITILWQSDDLRENKVKILDEVRTNLFYFNNTVFQVLPQIFQELSHCIGKTFDTADTKMLGNLPTFIEFGSWTGSDRDGHPGVDAEVTYQTILLQKRLCLRKYIESVKLLIKDISSSVNEINVNEDLLESIERDSSLFSEFASKTTGLNRLEPYRRKLDFMRLKLENSLLEVENSAVKIGLGRTLVGYREETRELNERLYYKRSSQFLRDLILIDRSLRQNRGTIIADSELALLILKVRVFGFHLAPLEIRQHSKVHREAILSIFAKIRGEIGDNLNDLLLEEIANPRPLGVSYFIDKCGSQTQELYATLRIALQALKEVSPRAIESYIISMTRDEQDIYILMLLMKEAGLIEVENGKITMSYLDIVPLFETRQDLANAPDVINRLFSTEIYRSYLLSRNNVQEIMIGYSDSTKDVGFFQSNYRLYTAQLSLVEVARKHGIKLQIFHGRGGSISRGGGSTNQSIRSQPIGSLYRTKITEQGEVIAYSYANPKIAFRHLEQIVSAMITRSIKDSESTKAVPEEYIDNFAVLAEIACVRYETMVKNNSDFINFYMEYTPLDLIERATIGSRPSRRTAGVVNNINELRAIPWIFSWMQSRLIFTTYFGVGTALDRYINERGIESLVDMYKNWGYFRVLIDNLHMICLKVDLDIAEEYLSLLQNDNHRYIFDDIKDEFILARKHLLKISGMKEFLENIPDKRNSILRRNPYIDPLSLMQIELLKRWREKRGESPDDETIGLQRLLLQTVNGIAAGLRNTG